MTIVNGGVTDAFLDCPAGPSPGSGILFLATWIDRKGIRDVVPVFSRLAREFPGLRITVAGWTPAEVVLADFPNDCHSAVRVIPQIRGDAALLAEYRSHAIYFAPSVFEGQLLTMLEAAAAGLAPVCTATCGMKDFIRSGENGLLAEVGDVAGLGDAVSRLVRNRNLTAQLGAQAQRDAREYTWNRSSEQFLAAVTAAATHLRTGGQRSHPGREHYFAGKERPRHDCTANVASHEPCSIVPQRPPSPPSPPEVARRSLPAACSCADTAGAL